MRTHQQWICLTLLVFEAVCAPPATGQATGFAGPHIDSIFPPATTAATRSAPITIAVSGANFVQGSTVFWHDTLTGTVQLQTTFGNSTQLTALVPPNLVATARKADIQVSNPSDVILLAAISSCPGTCSNSVTFLVNPPPSIVTALPNGVVGAAYQTQLAATGGTTPFVWSLSSGALPPGLALNSAGVVSGQPTSTGTFGFTVRLTDAAEGSATRDYTVRIFQPNIKPDVISACPTAVTAGNPGTRITVAVAGSFQAEVDWDGKPLQLESSSTSAGTMFLIARITPDLLATAGSHAITVVNLDTQARTVSDPISFRVLQAPAITSLNPQVTTEGARVRLTVNASNLVPSTTGCDAASTVQWNGQPLSGAVVSGGQIVADLPPALVVGTQASVTIANPDGVTSNAATVKINPAPQITTSALPSGVVGRQYPATGVQSTGGTTPFTWSISRGSGLTIDSATGVVGGAPSSAGDFDVLVGLTDAAGVSTSRTFRISILPVLNLSITGLPATISPGGNQPQFQLQVNAPGGFPADLRGRLTYTFQPDPDLQNPTVKDPALSISAGPDIQIPAFSQGLGVQLSPGTSAGTITVTLSNVTANGVDVSPAAPISASTHIASGPPIISSCIEEKSASGLRVRTVGFSPTRELKQALFRFSGSAGSNLKTTDLTVTDVGARLFSPFYNGQNGLTSFNFRYVQTFTIDGDPNALGTVSVILENAKGQSAPALAAGVCAGQ